MAKNTVSIADFRTHAFLLRVLQSLFLLAEQLVQGGTISWVRFGWSISGGLEVGAQTRWISGTPPVEFALDDFNLALEDFATMLSDHV